MGKTLLVNVPIEKIESQPIGKPLRTESAKQYLRLWEQHNGVQTIMYNANSLCLSAIYMEHDGKVDMFKMAQKFADDIVESFCPDELKSSPTRLRLDIKRAGVRPLSEALKILDYLVVHFSDAKGRSISTCMTQYV